MPKQPTDPAEFVDGIGPLPGGMDSGTLPQILDSTKVWIATNCTFRGGFVRNRPEFKKVAIDFGGDTALKSKFESGFWQSAGFFASDFGSYSLLTSQSGRLLEIIPDNQGSATIRDVTPQTNGVDDPNPAANLTAWFCDPQAERWQILNDGQSLPIFYDGTTARRSRGQNVIQYDKTAVNFTVPAVGALVTVQVVDLSGNNAAYAGPLNDDITIGSATYQVTALSTNVAVTGNYVTLAAIDSGAAGLLIPALSQLYVPPISTTSTQQFKMPLAWPLPPPSGNVFPIVVPGDTLQFHDLHIAASLGVVAGNYVTIGSYSLLVNKVTNGGKTLQLMNVNQYPPDKSITPGGLNPIPAHTFVGYSPTNTPVAITEQDTTALGVGVSFQVPIQTEYTGPIPATVKLLGFSWTLSAATQDAAINYFVTLKNVNDTPGNVVVAGAILEQVSAELPPGRMLTYGLGRIWECLTDGSSFIAGDIVGGPSGTPAYDFRDAVLRVTENSYLAGGGKFFIPGQLGSITAMKFAATLDASLGQGPLQVGTPNTIFSCQAPVDRTTWTSLTNPILTESLKGKGPLGQYGTTLVNSDTLFRAADGFGSLVLARKDFDEWRNTPISREVDYIISGDDQTLLQNATAVEFDNRWLVGCFPIQGPLGVYQQGLIALNLDPVSNMQSKLPPIYDGLWTGLNVLQFVSGTFGTKVRTFAFCYNSYYNKIELFELVTSADAVNLDNNNQPITWSFESASLFRNLKGKGPFDLVQLTDGEIYLSEIRGVVFVQSWYRPDEDSCWHPWHSVGICADNTESTDRPTQYRSRLGLGRPDSKEKGATSGRSATLGNNFQVRFQITGSCKFMGGMFKAVAAAETDFSTPICKPLCDTTGGQTNCEDCKITGDCITFPFVFYSLEAGKQYSNELLSFQVACPDGTTRTVYVPPGTINYTLPFPVGFSGPYPPLVMGCAAGGQVVETVPDNATQAQIDALVNAMILRCAQAIAEANVDCSPNPSPITNATVYYVHTCGAGETLSYSGTLPAWITIDAVNSRLVGAAGTYTGNSQSNADGTAQAVLNGWAAQELANGNLSCVSDCPLPDPAWVAPVISHDFGSSSMSVSGKVVTFAVSGTQPAFTSLSCGANEYFGTVNYNGVATNGRARFDITSYSNTEPPANGNVYCFVGIWINHTPGVDPPDYIYTATALGTFDLDFPVPDSTITPSTINIQVLANVNFDGLPAGGTGTIDGTVTIECAASICDSADWTTNPISCRLRIAGYLDSLFPAYAPALACGGSPTSWDGTLPQFTTSLGTAAYMGASTVDCMGGMEVTQFAAPVFYVPILQYNNIVPNGWDLAIYAHTSSGAATVLARYTRNDLSPIGVYTWDGPAEPVLGTPYNPPATITIEAYVP